MSASEFKYLALRPFDRGRAAVDVVYSKGWATTGTDYFFFGVKEAVADALSAAKVDSFGCLPLHEQTALRQRSAVAVAAHWQGVADSASRRGRLVHERIDAFLRVPKQQPSVLFEGADDATRPYLASALTFHRQMLARGFLVAASERSLASLHRHIAGTIDCIYFRLIDGGLLFGGD